MDDSVENEFPENQLVVVAQLGGNCQGHPLLELRLFAGPKIVGAGCGIWRGL